MINATLKLVKCANLALFLHVAFTDEEMRFSGIAFDVLEIFCSRQNPEVSTGLLTLGRAFPFYFKLPLFIC